MITVKFMSLKRLDADSTKKYLACFAASLFSFYNLFLLSSLNVIGVNFISDFHLTTASLGLLSSYDLWGNAIGFIPIGLLLDRYPVKNIGLSLLSLAIIATLGMSIATSFSMICLMRFFQGLASATSLLITMRLGSTLFDKKANITIGLMIVVAFSGGIAGNNIFAHIVQHFGWRHALLIVSGIGLICLFIIFLFLCEATNKVVTSISQVKLILKSLKKQNILSGICIGLINSPVFVLGTLWGNYYLVHTQHTTMMQAASLSSLLFVGIITGSPFWGFLADKWLGSWKIMYIACTVLLALSVILLLGKTLPLLTLGIIFFSFGFFCCTQNLVYPHISKNNPDFLISTATGIASLISNSIGAGLQIMFGLILQLKYANDHWGMAMFPIIFIISLSSIIMLNKISCFTQRQ